MKRTHGASGRWAYALAAWLVACALQSCGGNTSHTDGAATGASGNAAGSAGTSGGAGAGGITGIGPDMLTCASPLDCTLVNRACCSGGCGIPRLEQLVAVNSLYAAQVALDPCPGPCPPCAAPGPGADVGQNFVATCSNGQCGVVDIRQTSATSCTTQADCMLRTGAGCCPSCENTAWVAISQEAALSELVCGNGSVDCLACAAVPDPALSALCSAGHCFVYAPSCSSANPCP